jgi:hypothetical protein
MALIYRSLFNVESPTFVEEAPRLAEHWLRWKLDISSLTIEGSGSLPRANGVEAHWTGAREGEIGVFRALVYEERSAESEQVRTTFTAFSAGEHSWAQTDIERWATSPEAQPWIPVAPSIVSTLLEKEICRRGQFRLPKVAPDR